MGYLSLVHKALHLSKLESQLKDTKVGSGEDDEHVKSIQQQYTAITDIRQIFIRKLT